MNHLTDEETIQMHTVSKKRDRSCTAQTEVSQDLSDLDLHVIRSGSPDRFNSSSCDDFICGGLNSSTILEICSEDATVSEKEQLSGAVSPALVIITSDEKD